MTGYNILVIEGDSLQIFTPWASSTLSAFLIRAENPSTHNMNKSRKRGSPWCNPFPGVMRPTLPLFTRIIYLTEPTHIIILMIVCIIWSDCMHSVTSVNCERLRLASYGFPQFIFPRELEKVVYMNPPLLHHTSSCTTHVIFSNMFLSNAY